LVSDKVKNHTKAIDAVAYSEPYVISGGKDGLINFYEDSGFKLIVSVNCLVLLKGKSQLPMIRSVDLNQQAKTLIVGTLGSEIYEFSYS